MDVRLLFRSEDDPVFPVLIPPKWCGIHAGHDGPKELASEFVVTLQRIEGFSHNGEFQPEISESLGVPG